MNSLAAAGVKLNLAPVKIKKKKKKYDGSLTIVGIGWILKDWRNADDLDLVSNGSPRRYISPRPQAVDECRWSPIDNDCPGSLGPLALSHNI